MREPREEIQENPALIRCGPYRQALEQVRWQFFGHLTFKRQSEPEARRLARFSAMLRPVAYRSHTHFLRLLWCLRQERGDLGGQVHFHFLLAGLPPRAVTPRTCREAETWWTRKGGGNAVVTLYDPALHGVAYMLKVSAQDSRSRAGRESGKFGPGDCELMLSGGLRRLLGLRR
jgi:hypothetical protein